MGSQLEVGAFSAESVRKRWKEAKRAKSLPGARQRLCGLISDLVIFSWVALGAKGAVYVCVCVFVRVVYVCECVFVCVF